MVRDFFYFPYDITDKPNIVLQAGDVLKVDIGVHVKGRIADSAFTLTWDHTYDNLLEAVKAATDTGIRVSQEFQDGSCCV